MAKISAERAKEMEIERGVGLLGAVYWQPPDDKYKPQHGSADDSRLERLKELGLVKKDTRGYWVVTRKGVMTLNKSKKRRGRAR